MTEPETDAPEAPAARKPPAARRGDGAAAAATTKVASDSTAQDSKASDSTGSDSTAASGRAASGSDSTAGAGAGSAASRGAGERAATRAGLAVAGLGLLWLVAKLWAAYQQIHQNAGDTVAVATATLAVPAVVQATAVAGLAGGIAVRLLTPMRRYVAAPLGGLVVGAAALAAIMATYGSVPSVGGVATVVAVAGLLGGAAAGLGRHTAVAAAGLAGALGAFVVDTVLNSGTVLGHMMSWFGGGHDAIVACDQTTIDGVAACARIVDANSWVSHIDSVIAGLAAGLIAFWYLRRRDCGVKFPGYLVAGATTGLVLLASEGLARIGGAALAHAARQISDADATAVDLLASSRVIHGLLVFFVGAFVALVAFGRTLPPKSAPTASGRPGSSRPAGASARAGSSRPAGSGSSRPTGPSRGAESRGGTKPGA